MGMLPSKSRGTTTAFTRSHGNGRRSRLRHKIEGISRSVKSLGRRWYPNVGRTFACSRAPSTKMHDTPQSNQPPLPVPKFQLGYITTPISHSIRAVLEYWDHSENAVCTEPRVDPNVSMHSLIAAVRRGPSVFGASEMILDAVSAPEDAESVEEVSVIMCWTRYVTEVMLD